MPIGDSITYGYLSTTGNGYRGPLYEILSKADNSIEFVGTKHDGNMVNNAHNGYPGWRVNEISAEIFSASSTDGRSPNAIVDQKPNVILLHICTNDLNSDSLFEPDTASERVGVLIDRLFSAAPDVTIIVAQIIPANDPEVRARILRHNGRLEMEVARRRGAGRKILSAILPLNYKTVHLSDGLHPNDAGYQKMAEGWAAALADASRRGWISPADTGVDALKPFNGGS
ncbi:SGNH hydrolase-type esterase domain-containing protein [Peziza echinospora]|nr:SGNH hydrolase-type esterase domain-containing protein [Peziza echinospora]